MRKAWNVLVWARKCPRAGKNELRKQEARGQGLLEARQAFRPLSPGSSLNRRAGSCLLLASHPRSPCAHLQGWAEGGGSAQGQGLAGVDSGF